MCQKGHEATHWSKIGAASAPDVEIMAWARKNSCIVLTHDLDFSAILSATQGKKPSVIQLRSDNLDPEVTGPAVIRALAEAEADLHAGALLTLDASRMRLRVLPLLKKE